MIIGGGIGGLAAAVALHRVGIEAALYEKAPYFAEVGAGLSLWSNALLALRRLGLEAAALRVGSTIERTRTFLSTGKPAGELNVALLGAAMNAPSICMHRANLQRLLLDAAISADANLVQTGRECTGFEAEAGGIVALFADGSKERADILIGADGIHSVIRSQLFGTEDTRFAGCFAWRGIVEDTSELPSGEALVVLAPGAHAGCFHCGSGKLYWFVTRNAPPGTKPGPLGNRAEVIGLIKDWRVPFRAFVEATDEAAILRDDVIDRPPRIVWGKGRVTLLGDAAHAATPYLGQGACQALEDAVVLADSLRQHGATDAGLRRYEARRRQRANFVVRQSWRMGTAIQLEHPLGLWLRDKLTATRWAQRQTKQLFARVVNVDLPNLGGRAQ